MQFTDLRQKMKKINLQELKFTFGALYISGEYLKPIFLHMSIHLVWINI